MGKSRNLHQRKFERNRGNSNSSDSNARKRPSAGDGVQYNPVLKFLMILAPLVLVSVISYTWYTDQLKQRVRTPLAEQRIIGEDATLATIDALRFWGTYRSGLYFGLKTRTPRSPVFGLMWLTQLTGEMPPPVRHWCRHEDGLQMYSWFAHDGSSFGLQEIADKYITLSIDYVKRPYGGLHGGDWTARINVKPKPGAEKAVVSLFFYMALDGEGAIESELSGNRLEAINGMSPHLGTFKLLFPKQRTSPLKENYLVTWASGLEVLTDTMMHGFSVMPLGTDNLQYLGLRGRSVPRDKAEEGPNFIVKQVTVRGNFTSEVVFESQSYVDRPNQLAGDVYSKEVKKRLFEFDEKLEEKFHLHEKGFTQDEIGFAKAGLSNMIGSIGYFYGSSFVRSKYTEGKAMLYPPAALFTGVPSRSFFPRGFLWDEGFHNLLISRWDMDLSMQIIGHWLDLMNIDGWIPREQILGVEALAKVPAEFVVQDAENANPPTFFLPLQRIVKQLIKSDDPQHKLYLKHLYPRLRVWYDWFNTTQTGPDYSTYRWRGRDSETKRELNPKTLTSGLDDFPRASHPSDEERHLDLRCWMALASSVMADIAKSLNEPSNVYQETYDMLTDNHLLDKYHWSEMHQMYADYGLHSNQVKLERPKPPPLQPGQRPPPPQEKVRVVRQTPQLQHVNAFGYVSLFPFLLKIVDPHSPKLGKILTDLNNPNLLWTKYGLRSLAKSSPLYMKHNTEHDPPYWRGAIWININYLVVSALNHYANIEGPHQQKSLELYKELRQNIIDNIILQFKSTGYIWENYDDRTGVGKGTHPFTGWSALLMLIMAEDYA